MKVKIKTQLQFESVVYTTLNQHENCTITIQDENSNACMYFVSSKLSDNNVLLSLCAGDKSIGDVVKINDGKSKMNWIKENCRIDFDYADIVVDIPSSQSKDNNENAGYFKLNHNDYRKEYLQKYCNMKKYQVPILIENSTDAMELFTSFLHNHGCNKIIFSFSVIVPDLKHRYILELVIDKIYVYGRTLISFVSVRPDMKDITFTCPSDSVTEYFPKNRESDARLISDFYDYIMTCFYRCTLVSDQEIEIKVYSNCKLN